MSSEILEQIEYSLRRKAEEETKRVHATPDAADRIYEYYRDEFVDWLVEKFFQEKESWGCGSFRDK